MATDLGASYTLAELFRSFAPDGSQMSAIDVLSERRGLIEEGKWVEANGDNSHTFLRTSSEPVGSLVRLNEGASFEAGASVPVTEQLARMESNLRIDTRILDKARDPVKYRRDKEAMHLRGMLKRFERIVMSKSMTIAGSAVAQGDMDVDPKTVNGLGKRYGKIATNQVVSLGGSGSGVLGSIWLIKWSPEGMFFINPKDGSKTIVTRDLREQLVYDAAGKPYTAVITNFAFEFGMGIGDERCVKRLCNVAASGNYSFWNDGTDKAIGENALIDLIETFPEGDLTGVVAYAGPNIIAQMRKRINAKGSYFNLQQMWGRQMLAFQDVPIVRLDSLAMDESTIS